VNPETLEVLDCDLAPFVIIFLLTLPRPALIREHSHSCIAAKGIDAYTNNCGVMWCSKCRELHALVPSATSHTPSSPIDAQLIRISIRGVGASLGYVPFLHYLRRARPFVRWLLRYYGRIRLLSDVVTEHDWRITPCFVLPSASLNSIGIPDS
jgi:hypothetical protein